MSVSDHHPRQHGRPPRLQDLIIQGCYVRRRHDGAVYQVETGGRKVMVELKPDTGDKPVWISIAELNRDYELVAS